MLKSFKNNYRTCTLNNITSQVFSTVLLALLCLGAFQKGVSLQGPVVHFHLPAHLQSQTAYKARTLPLQKCTKPWLFYFIYSTGGDCPNIVSTGDQSEALYFI